ncbi:MAG: ribosome recycling factor [Flavobacteriaceae bacterium]|nr:ribosome recycling factor [Flavobacteriaceae bacterium]
MKEEIEIIVETTKEEMENAVAHLKRELSNIRAGKASPNMLKGVIVDYYGSQTPLSQVANINTTDAQTITVQPWEKNLIPEIEKGIQNANLGFNPMNNGESIIITVPPLTEERRKELAKSAKAVTEHDKVSVRNARKDANNNINKLDVSDDMKKNAVLDIQKLTDTYTNQINELYKVKEVEIMKV